MKKKILLIDDDEDLLRSFEVTLENSGFDVITAFDGENGFLRLKNDKPDLLVLDVMMNTNLEGYNLLHVIKNVPEYKKLPIIMLTGMRDAIGVNLTSAVEDESIFQNVRFQDKPVNPRFLAEIIEEMLKA